MGALMLISVPALAADAQSRAQDKNGQDDGVETENIFGFTVGTDTDKAGAKSMGFESAARLRKRDGSYTGVASKVEFAYGLTDYLNVAFAVLGDHHRIRGVTDLDNIRFFGFNGLGTEIRWRLVQRGPSPIGVTLQLEPSWQTHDETSGKRATKYGSENKLAFDTELVKEKLIAAFNLLYDVERVRERGSAVWEEGSNFGLAWAASYQVVPKTFVSGEVRYLRAYDGLGLNRFAGEAVFVGPAIYGEIAPKTTMSLVWNVQVWGKEVGNPAHLDLKNFERHQVRVKIGREF